MKKLLLLLAIGFVSCEKQETAQPTPAPVVQPPPVIKTQNGVAFFYAKRLSPDSYWGNGFDLYVDGKYISGCGSLPNFVPSCGSVWGVNYSGNDGVHSYIAKIHTENPPPLAYSWTGTFTLSQDTCIVIQLAR